MNVREVTRVDASTGAALEMFEQQFHYPLSLTDHFSISHGPEYLAFFSAMGPSTLLIAERNGEILGTVVLVSRQLRITALSEVSHLTEKRIIDGHYICDLKVGVTSRSTFVLAALMESAARIIRQKKSQSCYAVVMAGTKSQPTSYTGRIGIPEFRAVGEIVIARFQVRDESDHYCITDASPELYSQTFEALASNGVETVSCERSLRSKIEIQRFCHRDGAAVGLLEDTRRGKRLYHKSGAEIVSSHLSGIRWRWPEAAGDMIRFALAQSRVLGFPAMFCALPSAAWGQLGPVLRGLAYEATSATIFGYGLPLGLNWWIDTSEI